MIQTHTMPNGIRIIHYPTQSAVAYLAVLTKTGSRHETAELNGMAHFIEHNFFKGSKKRKAHHIINRLEDVGGDLNAYTNKEETVLNATFLTRDYERAAELLKDMFFDSVFPVKEIEKEKDVVLDEINSYNDSPAELIYDEFEEFIMPTHPLGMPVLGKPENIKRFTRDDVIGFREKYYGTNQTVISSAGNIPFAKVVRQLEKHFGSIATKSTNGFSESPADFVNGFRKEARDTHQAHCIVGVPTFKASDKRRFTIRLLNNILGGSSMNSRLNMSLREKHGLAYNVDSAISSYTDNGLLAIYIGTDKGNMEKCLDLTQREFNKLKNTQLTATQLEKAKRQMMGQIAVSAESTESFMLSMGRTYLFFNEIISLENYFKRIESITTQQIQDLANELFADNRITTLVYE